MMNKAIKQEFWVSIRYPIFFLGGLSYALHLIGMSEQLVNDLGYHFFILAWSFAVSFSISCLYVAYKTQIVPIKIGLIRKAHSPIGFWVMVCVFTTTSVMALILSVAIWLAGSVSA
jgi:hypothetical protein